ncbi:MAG TPA: hypothetical protein VFQ84_02700 [Arenimonas sp.]|uniref:hypothetical protein n=1 Tax=Arenimonas sp. TaxID=1872635 RepID=UPI002D80D7FB|nr:hypothetical protein [Arenimonas sp.]HEU0152237.1 hypothetical protein [Arenimonas sp.]
MRKSIALLIIALLAGTAGQVQANSERVAQPASGSTAPVSASASVNFRIVIRETLSFGQQQKARLDTPPMVRTVSVEDGREVVTLARP